MANVESVNKENCCGCGLCVNVCPRQCIKMIPDKEGFWYPKIDAHLCTSCGLCMKLCAGIKNEEKCELKNAYVGFSCEEYIREKSSSGGLFYALAETILQRGGTVYGAAFLDNFSVVHMRIDNINNLSNILTSKYVQSDIQDTYVSVAKDLRDGKKVLFSGTPCQVGALHKYIKKQGLAQGLYLVDFVCHGVPSPGVWKSYLKYINRKETDIETVNFRDKSRGWHNFCIHVKYKNNSCFTQSHELNAYMNTFLSDKNLRPSCYDCKYKDCSYVSDITLGDAWKIEKDYPEYADDKGTSLFITHTEKGEHLIKHISANFKYRATNYDMWSGLNPSILKSTNRPISRDEFFDLFAEDDGVVFWKKQCVIPNRKLLRYYIKEVIRCTGWGKIIRRWL